MKNIMIGNSMLPTLPKISFIKFIKQKSYNVGDIIVFINKFWLPYRICHRIISISNDGKTFTAKGDNRNFIEDYERDVPIEDIVGKVILEE
jgi:signal peptidase I